MYKNTNSATLKQCKALGWKFAAVENKMDWSYASQIKAVLYREAKKGKFTKNDASYLFDLKNHSIVQFYHRNIAYFITLYIISIGLIIFNLKIEKLYRPLSYLLIILFIQIILGIFTLLSGLNIALASAHQISSVILVLSALNLYYSIIK